MEPAPIKKTQTTNEITVPQQLIGLIDEFRTQKPQIEKLENLSIEEIEELKYRLIRASNILYYKDIIPRRKVPDSDFKHEYHYINEPFLTQEWERMLGTYDRRQIEEAIKTLVTISFGYPDPKTAEGQESTELVLEKIMEQYRQEENLLTRAYQFLGYWIEYARVYISSSEIKKNPGLYRIIFDLVETSAKAIMPPQEKKI